MCISRWLVVGTSDGRVFLWDYRAGLCKELRRTDIGPDDVDSGRKARAKEAAFERQRAANRQRLRRRMLRRFRSAQRLIKAGGGTFMGSIDENAALDSSESDEEEQEVAEELDGGASSCIPEEDEGGEGGHEAEDEAEVVMEEAGLSGGSPDYSNSAHHSHRRHSVASSDSDTSVLTKRHSAPSVSMVGFPGHTCAVTCVKWNERATHLMTGDAEGHVVLWDMSNEEALDTARPSLHPRVVYTWRAHQEPVTGLAFSRTEWASHATLVRAGISAKELQRNVSLRDSFAAASTLRFTKGATLMGDTLAQRAAMTGSVTQRSTLSSSTSLSTGLNTTRIGVSTLRTLVPQASVTAAAAAKASKVPGAPTTPSGQVPVHPLEGSSDYELLARVGGTSMIVTAGKRTVRVWEVQDASVDPSAFDSTTRRNMPWAATGSTWGGGGGGAGATGRSPGGAAADESDSEAEPEVEQEEEGGGDGKEESLGTDHGVQGDGSMRVARLAGISGHAIGLQTMANGLRCCLQNSNMDLIVMDTRQRRSTLREHSGRLASSCAFGVTGRVVVGCEDGTVRLFSQRSGRRIGVMLGHQSRINSCAYSWDGQHVVTGSAAGVIKVWVPHLVTPVAADSIHKAEVRFCALPNHTQSHALTATGAKDGSVVLWDNEGRLRFRVEGRSPNLHHLVCADEGRALIGVSAAGVRIWDLDPDTPAVPSHRDLTAAAGVDAWHASPTATAIALSSSIGRQPQATGLMVRLCFALSFVPAEFSHHARSSSRSLMRGLASGWAPFSTLPSYARMPRRWHSRPMVAPSWWPPQTCDCMCGTLACCQSPTSSSLGRGHKQSWLARALSWCWRTLTP